MSQERKSETLHSPFTEPWLIHSPEDDLQKHFVLYNPSSTTSVKLQLVTTFIFCLVTAGGPLVFVFYRDVRTLYVRWTVIFFVALNLLALTYVMGRLILKLKGFDADGGSGIKIVVADQAEMNMSYAPKKVLVPIQLQGSDSSQEVFDDESNQPNSHSYGTMTEKVSFV
eukprot:TRINITY_DN3838_c0_g1_i2.p1 TRINITY_DN3838_c0_g1~~TRINITY_DN3838_c0_g1_i2.p1  ORF type:complete len:169 (-),score=28.09 TRINITY_DN3838_c0_g1_i2:56-562(-)